MCMTNLQAFSVNVPFTEQIVFLVLQLAEVPTGTVRMFYPRVPLLEYSRKGTEVLFLWWQIAGQDYKKWEG